MPEETYTPGHTENATAFMTGRTFDSHGQFFATYLKPGLSVVDCGCGPGTITIGIAERVAPGKVVGVDFGESQIAIAQQAKVNNLTFQTANCYALPFHDNSFDRVFSHALMEHLSEPVKAVREFHRVLKPGGIAGVCCPDWGGFIFAPKSEELTAAVKTYRDLQTANGGDVEVGRKLGGYLGAAGFTDIQMDARYECYEDRERIGEYLAQQLDAQNEPAAAKAFRDWSQQPAAMFAQSWVWAVGTRGNCG
jgi:SAM-dependent methyltransferase